MHTDMFNYSAIRLYTLFFFSFLHNKSTNSAFSLDKDRVEINSWKQDVANVSLI